MTAFEEKYLNRVCDIVLKHIDKNKFHVFLFGSRARAEYPSRTDIDVGIFGDEPFAVAEPKAWLALQNELEEAWLPYTIDIIDFYTSIITARFEELNIDLFREYIKPVE